MPEMLTLGEAAAYLGIIPRLVRAAVDYYAEFADEVDEDAAVAESVERDERARWERQQRAPHMPSAGHHVDRVYAMFL